MGRRIHLAATPGGHLDLLLALRGAFDGFDPVWVTAPGSAADDLRARGEQVRTLARFHGFSPALASYAVKAGRLVRAEHPEIVVTSGSGSVAPFCALARASGAKLLFLETMARIENPSSGGRILSRLADSVVVQWPEMIGVYRGAVVARPALLEDRAETAISPGEGTFVALGTHIDPFPRLLEMAGRARAEGVLPGPVVAQTGVTEQVPDGFEAQPWMAPPEIQQHVERAELVVCHAGSGLIARCLRAGRRPIVLPRLAGFGEHVDDHQLQLVRKLGEMDCIVPVEDRITAEDVAASKRPLPAASLTGLPAMVDVVAAELRRLAA